MIHWCWKEEAATACHRCAADVTDESIECCHNACFGKADPEPAESRWTHVLPNLQRTVLRRVLWGIGTDAIVGGPENVSVGEVQLADEADENFIKVLQGVRRKATNAYLKDDATFKELGVYIIMLDVFDGEPLFPLLGDRFKAEPKSEDVLSCNMSAATAIKQRPHPQETASNVQSRPPHRPFPILCQVLPHILPQVPLSQSSRTRSLRLSRSPLGTPPMGCSLARRTRCKTCLPPEMPRSLCRPASRP